MSSPAQLADAEDYWVRELLLKGGTRANGAPAARTLKNFIKRAVGRPWHSEISGRALSRANDIVERGQAALDTAKQKAAAAGKSTESYKFHCVIYSAVAAVRAIPPFDAYYTSKPEDAAHSDLVALTDPAQAPLENANAEPKESHEPFRRLAEVFSGCEPSQISMLYNVRK